MKRALILGLSFIACASLLSKISADEIDEEKLLKDTSRSDRFRLVKREAAKELGLDLGGLSADIVKRFSFPGDVEDDSIFGIDLSHHNEDGCKCTVNWAQIESQKVRFAYLKATQGSTGQDARFGANWNALEKTGIRRGAYHFLSPFTTPEDQIKNFMKTMGPLRPNDLPPVMDIEWTDPADPDNDGWKSKSSDEIVAFALKWLTGIEAATGRTPVIYTSRAWWKDRITDEKLAKFDRYPIWLAQYVPDSKGQELPKNLPQQWAWKIWQFTESGGISGGLSGHLDVSVFKGSLDQFHQALGVALPTPMPMPLPMPTPMPTPGDANQNPDPPKDANLAPGGGPSPSGGNPPSGPTPAPAPAGPADTGTPKTDPAKDANAAPANSGNPPTGSPPASDGTTAPKPTGSSNAPKGNRNQDNFFAPGGNPNIRME